MLYLDLIFSGLLFATCYPNIISYTLNALKHRREIDGERAVGWTVTYILLSGVNFLLFHNYAIVVGISTLWFVHSLVVIGYLLLNRRKYCRLVQPFAAFALFILVLSLMLIVSICKIGDPIPADTMIALIWGEVFLGGIPLLMWLNRWLGF